MSRDKSITVRQVVSNLKGGKGMRVIAKYNLTLHPHTWTRGMDYELVQKRDYATIASNEGQVNFAGESMKRLREMFIFPDDSAYGND